MLVPQLLLDETNGRSESNCEVLAYDSFKVTHMNMTAENITPTSG